MSIGTTSGLEPERTCYVDKESGEVWIVESLFDCPSVTLRSMRTGEKMSGGIGCRNFDNFVKLIREDGNR